MQVDNFLSRLRKEDYREKASFKKMESLASKLFKENADLKLTEKESIFKHIYQKEKKFLKKESQDWNNKQRDYSSSFKDPFAKHRSPLKCVKKNSRKNLSKGKLVQSRSLLDRTRDSQRGKMETIKVGR